MYAFSLYNGSGCMSPSEHCWIFRFLAFEIRYFSTTDLFGLTSSTTRTVFLFFYQSSTGFFFFLDPEQRCYWEQYEIVLSWPSGELNACLLSFLSLHAACVLSIAVSAASLTALHARTHTRSYTTACSFWLKPFSCATVGSKREGQSTPEHGGHVFCSDRVGHGHSQQAGTGRSPSAQLPCSAGGKRHQKHAKLFIKHSKMLT